jgi:CheY-like chemotaxis protein
MPVIDGFECAKRIRLEPNLYGTPKLAALSADALDATKFKALQTGFNMFIAKPCVSIDDLARSIELLMDDYQQSA